jgi:peptide/nickel transport system permease protein
MQISHSFRFAKVGRVRGLPLADLWLARVVIRRLFFAIPLLGVVSALSFVLVSLGGNAAQTIIGAGITGTATRAQYKALKHQLGLDKPVYIQYWHWLVHAVHGDLGTSLYSAQPVTTALNARLPVTLSLVAGVLIVTLVVGVGLGIVSAAKGGAISRFVDGFALGGFALPSFWVGAVLIGIFAVDLRWLPATGYVPFSESPHRWLLSLILPVAALAVHSVAAIAKQTREAMLDAIGSEYIRMAWARGLSPASIFFRHALKNAGIRVVTVLGLLVVGLLAGTVFVEAVFALPGLGGLAVNSAIQTDLPVMQGIVVYFTVIVVVVNLAIDLAYSWLDPRVRTQ